MSVPVDPTAPPATPTTPDAELPTWVQDMLDEYGFTLSPEQAAAFANMTVNMGLQMAKDQMDYQQMFIEQKAKELDLSAKQTELMTKQFEFQSGKYWDWFSGEKFEFEKQMAADQADVSRLNLRTQKGLSKEELARSKNATLSTMYQTEAAKANAEAEKWAAMSKMGATDAMRQTQATPRDLLWAV